MVAIKEPFVSVNSWKNILLDFDQKLHALFSVSNAPQFYNFSGENLKTKIQRTFLAISTNRTSD